MRQTHHLKLRSRTKLRKNAVRTTETAIKLFLKTKKLLFKKPKEIEIGEKPIDFAFSPLSRHRSILDRKKEAQGDQGDDTSKEKISPDIHAGTSCRFVTSKAALAEKVAKSLVDRVCAVLPFVQFVF